MHYYHGYGLDIDLKHGAVVYMQWEADEESDVLHITDVEVLHQYDSKSSCIGEKSSLKEVLDFADRVILLLLQHSDDIILEDFSLRDEPFIVMEYSANRIHYSGARKLAAVQQAHIVGILAHQFRGYHFPTISFEPPWMTKRILKEKLPKSVLEWTLRTKTYLGVDVEFDEEGDIADAMAVLLSHVHNQDKERKI